MWNVHLGHSARGHATGGDGAGDGAHAVGDEERREGEGGTEVAAVAGAEDGLAEREARSAQDDAEGGDGERDEKGQGDRRVGFGEARPQHDEDEDQPDVVGLPNRADRVVVEFSGTGSASRSTGDEVPEAGEVRSLVVSPNILLIMTDEERYPPPYETAEVAEFRRTQMPARERVRSGGLELHRHYAGSVACVPSRATLFTGQYPSLHGVAKTSGIAKQATDPAMGWLDPDEVPTLGDWFRAGGYQTHYRGKWHVSHADLEIPGSHESVMASDDDGRPIAHAVEAYRKADRLNPFGFSGWIGREAHGAVEVRLWHGPRRRVRRAGGRVVRRSRCRPPATDHGSLWPRS